MINVMLHKKYYCICEDVNADISADISADVYANVSSTTDSFSSIDQEADVHHSLSFPGTISVDDCLRCPIRLCLEGFLLLQ